MVDRDFHKQPTLPEFAVEEKPLPPLPEKIGPYKIESLLTKGGMSLLYLGLHPDSKRPLAIKVLSPQYVTHQEMIDRFFKEAKIIEMTDHPNIVKVYGQGDWEGGLYIAMELIQGISLSQFILQHSLSLRRSFDIILQVAYALLHLHTHGVIHRDIKPENILITEDGEVKVIDFGIAQLHGEESSKSAVVGTPDYMSPEQKNDPMSVSFSSDIYSLGIIAYELVLGKLSYGVLHLSHLPKGLRTILEKALAASPKERYQDIVDFITDITQYLKSGELEKERPGTDQVKELIENIQRAQASLSPSSLPNWPELEMGIAKPKGVVQMGLYYDFFKLSQNMYAILIAETSDDDIDGVIHTAAFRGMLRMLLNEKLSNPKETFQALPFIHTLNKMLYSDSMKEQFGVGLLILDVLREQLTFISCGNGSLALVPSGSHNPRLLRSNNPPLGQDPFAEMLEITDNWNIGDTLTLHCFDTPGALEKLLLDTVSETALLSSARQPEAMLKKLLANPSFANQKKPKAIISLERIS